MPTRVLTDINLLPQTSFESTNVGKALNWMLVTGRVILVLTMLVVIAGFLSRFYFDVKLNDLNEEVKQKQAVVKSYAAIEKEMRDVLSREEMVAKFVANNLGSEAVFREIVNTLPLDVSLDSLSIADKTVSVKGIALSETGFAGFLANLGKSSVIIDSRLGKTEFDQKTGVITFGVSANVNIKEK